MQLGENTPMIAKEAAEAAEGVMSCEACGTAQVSPLEYLLFSWDQFVNELEFE